MSSTSSSSRASNGSGTQACAACKYQRRKCTPDCILAPYFPPENQRQFLNAHRLFGVSNILKIIRNLDPIQRSEAMRSIIFQADARARDPVGGCYAMIVDLWRQIQHQSAELDNVMRYLAVYRDQFARAAQGQGLPPPAMIPDQNHQAEPAMLQHLQLPIAAASAPTMIPYNNQQIVPQQQQLPNYSSYPPQQLQQLQTNNFHCPFPADDSQTHHHLMQSNNDNDKYNTQTIDYNRNVNDEDCSFMDNSRNANFDNEYDDDVKPHLIGMLDANPPLLGNPSEPFPCRFGFRTSILTDHLCSFRT
ncbi:LOB domain-containing protein 22-like [Aristolochia californica]|uniref:LOB domain-containing protein 22-like n=1 Tax=Aristolochia californica TaxID=171875 RepID=UPI0035D6DE1B